MNLRGLQAAIEAGLPVRSIYTDIDYVCGAVKYQGAYIAVDKDGISEFPSFDALCRYMGADGLSEWEEARALPPAMAQEVQRIQPSLPFFAPAGTPVDLAILISAIRVCWPLDQAAS